MIIKVPCVNNSRLKMVNNAASLLLLYLMPKKTAYYVRGIHPCPSWDFTRTVATDL